MHSQMPGVCPGRGDVEVSNWSMHYIDNPLADENWLREYYQEIEETEQRKQNLENPFDGTEALET